MTHALSNVLTVHPSLGLGLLILCVETRKAGPAPEGATRRPRSRFPEVTGLLCHPLLARHSLGARLRPTIFKGKVATYDPAIFFDPLQSIGTAFGRPKATKKQCERVAACCVRAASSQADAAATSAMNSRRLTRTPSSAIRRTFRRLLCRSGSVWAGPGLLRVETRPNPIGERASLAHSIPAMGVVDCGLGG